MVGPPRSGKTVPAGPVIDALGAVVTTSTKVDLPSWTLGARERLGPVAVFDPEGVWGWPNRARWSPAAGCEDPDTALDRARAFVAAKPLTDAARRSDGGPSSRSSPPVPPTRPRQARR